ncbi:MAG: membrane protein insertase YidC [Paracoccaceae bacterium]
MDAQNTKNLILAMVLSFLVLFGWTLLFPPPEISDQPGITENEPLDSLEESDQDKLIPSVSESSVATVTASRVGISTKRLSGSIWLKGGRIDDLQLSDYKTSLMDEALEVTLLQKDYLIHYGWQDNSKITEKLDLPGPNTIWKLVSGTELTERTPIKLKWDNGKGLTFERVIEIDKNYMFKITQTVINSSNNSYQLQPYGVIQRNGRPDTIGFFILHEGVVEMSDKTLNEITYKKMTKEGILSSNKTEWAGFTDKYWMTTLIAEPGKFFNSKKEFNSDQNRYLIEMKLGTQEINPNSRGSITTFLFAGAKEVSTIKYYEKNLEIYNFIDSVDWGWFFFLTKPIFSLLEIFNSYIGNMGWSIILLTLFMKTLLLPLAYKSFVSMSKLKKLQPEMEKIKERAGDDRVKLQQEMMNLYKTQKVNPAAGCLPILLQIPIFFSLYKVLFVTIEMRHAPFIGWIKDLSAPDPTSFLNLFGLLPYSTPGPESIFGIISIGVFPILMGVTMWMQQKLNPTPTDKTQAMIFAWMPWIFMFMLGQFSSGLVIYWVANNTIQFIQQYLIMTSQGVRPDVFGNILASIRSIKPDKDK